MKHRILFVDDEPHVLHALRRMLHAQEYVWDMTFSEHPRKAWDTLLRKDFDAVVSDFQMPGMDGLQLLKCIRQSEHTRDVPVIILTGLLDRDLKRRALELGATDLLNKPVESPDLLTRLRNVLQLKAYQDRLKRQNAELDQTVREQTAQITASRRDIIWRLGKAAEFRDEDRGNHVIRVGFSSRIIAELLGMGTDFAEEVFLAAPLHDIGKIGIPDAILLKPDTLTADEWTIMKQHCAIGAAILRQDSRMATPCGIDTPDHWAPPNALCDNPLLDTAATIALTHHEKWDGSGYPQGLAGENIPLVSRIVAISDVYDALTSPRPYKLALAQDTALEIIRHGVGSHFDPAVYSAFERSLDRIREIRAEFPDDLQKGLAPLAMPGSDESATQPFELEIRDALSCGIGMKA